MRTRINTHTCVRGLCLACTHVRVAPSSPPPAKMQLWRVSLHTLASSSYKTIPPSVQVSSVSREYSAAVTASLRPLENCSTGIMAGKEHISSVVGGDKCPIFPPRSEHIRWWEKCEESRYVYKCLWVPAGVLCFHPGSSFYGRISETLQKRGEKRRDGKRDILREEGPPHSHLPGPPRRGVNSVALPFLPAPPSCPPREKQR